MTPDVSVFAKGVVIGVAVAAPVGPMSVLCMRRTLAQGWRFGLGTGAGIALGDAFYALVAALGLAGVMRFIVNYERPLHAIAGAVLLVIGWRTFFAAPANVERDSPRSGSTAAAFVSALVLTLTNPPTIVSFLAIFTALEPAGFGRPEGLAIACGVLGGSLAWWVSLTGVVAAARHAIGVRTGRWIDRISGAVLGLLGAAEIRRAL